MTEIILKQGTGEPDADKVKVAEVAIDTGTGDLYTKLADGSVKHLNPEYEAGDGGDSLWEESGSDIYYDAGNVGIGTDNPAYTLDIQATPSSFNPVRFSGYGASIDAFLYTDATYWSIGDTAAYEGNLWGGNKANNYVHAYTNGTERMRIDANGLVGIGGEPGTRTAGEYLEQAKEQIAGWKAEVKKRTAEQPEASTQEITLEVTDGDFGVFPTTEALADKLAERSIGGGAAKLQVAGNGYFSGNAYALSFQATGGVYNTTTTTGYLQVEGTNCYQWDALQLYPSVPKDLGNGNYKWKDGWFSGNVNANAVNAVAWATPGGTGYIQINGSNTVELRSTVIFPFNNNTVDWGRSDKRWKDGYFSGTIYGTVDDVPTHVKAITPTQIANWDAGTGGGGGGATTDGRISDTQITNWDQAHGWGNHASAGYQPAGSYAAGNHTHPEYLTSGSLSGYATETWVGSNYQAKGNYALVGASYTKAESNAAYQPKGSYETAGTAYTKAQSDAKYELKGAGGLPAGDWACSGSITAAGNITAYYSSDERLKDDIKEMPVGLIDDIQPSTWSWKEGGKASGGVVAQQLQSCGLGQWVNEAPNGDLGVDYNALIGVLVAEVQSLKARVMELENAD